MKIYVESVQKADNVLPQIVFSTCIGRARGTWQGSIPEVNRGYDVEFDVTET